MNLPHLRGFAALKWGFLFHRVSLDGKRPRSIRSAGLFLYSGVSQATVLLRGKPARLFFQRLARMRSVSDSFFSCVTAAGFIHHLPPSALEVEGFSRRMINFNSVEATPL